MGLGSFARGSRGTGERSGIVCNILLKADIIATCNIKSVAAAAVTTIIQLLGFLRTVVLVGSMILKMRRS